MSGSDESHSISNLSRVQRLADASFSRDWSHERPYEEVSLIKEEGLAAREESTEEGGSGEEPRDEALEEAPVPKKKMSWLLSRFDKALNRIDVRGLECYQG